jgi:hypothetical protein
LLREVLLLLLREPLPKLGSMYLAVSMFKR